MKRKLLTSLIDAISILGEPDADMSTDTFMYYLLEEGNQDKHALFTLDLLTKSYVESIALFIK